ncbi:hypothetical protein [Arthrobacter rhizosphaerae]|uniref:hypothetical protein n=1 Tax=Arthrobacter rhizosphaerae TaxID=2855490 RepID=UPI001FF5C838|nr:hypothetical protein [Arthrobacter rhizosphaerae]
MKNLALDLPGKSTVTLVRWSKKPDPMIRFILLTILGLILGLVLMMFMPFLQSFGAIALFTLFFAAIFTAPAVSDERSFMTGLTKRVNDTIVEVTGTPDDQLSVRQFRQLVKSGEHVPLLVSGVPGLNLHVERASLLELSGPGRWRAVFTVIPPENGTDSFDRLLSAAIQGAR